MRFSGTRRGRDGVESSAGTGVGLRVCGGEVAGGCAGRSSRRIRRNPRDRLPGKELPDAPGEKKKESANPAQQIQDVTKQIVSQTTDTAKALCLKARDWESGWIAGNLCGEKPQAGADEWAPADGLLPAPDVYHS